MSMDMKTFLETVKGSEVSGRVDKALAILAKVEILSPEDFVDTTKDSIERSFGTSITAGTFGFIGRALTKANVMYAEPTMAPSTPVGGGFPSSGNAPQPAELAAAVTNAVVAVLGKKEIPKVHVNLDDAIDKLKLSGLPQALWPKSWAVDVLATEAARMVKKGINVPFVFCDLKHFLPSWADTGMGDEPPSDDEEGSKLLVKQGKSLDIVRWQAAFDKYALGVAAVAQMNLVSALAHKDICMAVALRAPLSEPPRKAQLGVIYDETARRLWSQRAASGEHGFEVNIAAMAFDPAILRQAEATYDSFRAIAGFGKGPGKGKDKSKGLQCYKCGVFGHIAPDCKEQAQGVGNGKAKGKGKDKQCFKCGGYGHVKSECRQGLKRTADGAAKGW